MYKKVRGILVFLLFLSLLGGSVRASFFTSIAQEKEEYIEKYFLESQLKVEYRVEDIYKKKEFDIDYLVQIISVDGVNIQDKKLHGVVRAPRNYSLSPAQVWSSKTQLYPVSKQDDPFKYFFFSRGIYFRAYPYEFSFNSTQKMPLSSLYELREKFIGTISSLYPQDAASLLNGILI